MQYLVTCPFLAGKGHAATKRSDETKGREEEMHDATK